MAFTSTMEEFILENFLGGLESPFAVGVGDILGDIFGPWGVFDDAMGEDIVWDILGIPDAPRASVPPVVISEQPSTVLPSGIGPGGVSQEEYVWPEWSLEPILETRPGLPPDPWPGSPADVLGDPLAGDTAEQLEQENVMAHDWGHLIRQGIGAFIPGAEPAGMAPPAGFVDPLPPPVITGNGVVSGIDPRTGRPHCHRRRRRRLLTEGDFNDLMRIATLPNKDTVKVALAKAVGRR